MTFYKSSLCWYSFHSHVNRDKKEYLWLQVFSQAFPSVVNFHTVHTWYWWRRCTISTWRCSSCADGGRYVHATDRRRSESLQRGNLKSSEIFKQQGKFSFSPSSKKKTVWDTSVMRRQQTTKVHQCRRRRRSQNSARCTQQRKRRPASQYKQHTWQ